MAAEKQYAFGAKQQVRGCTSADDVADNADLAVTRAVARQSPLYSPTSRARAASPRAQGVKLELIEFQPPAMKEDEVFVDVHYCGMCHSDIHSECGAARRGAPPSRDARRAMRADALAHSLTARLPAPGPQRSTTSGA